MTAAGPSRQAGLAGDEVPGASGLPTLPAPAALTAGDAPAGDGSRRGKADQAAPEDTANGRSTRPTEAPSPARPAAEPPSAAAPAAERLSPATPAAEPSFTAPDPAESNGHDGHGGDNGQLQLRHPYAAFAEHDGGGDGFRAGDVTLIGWPVDGAPAGREQGRSDARNGRHQAARPPATSQARPAGAERDRRSQDPSRGDPPRSQDASRGDLPRRRDRAAAASSRLAPEHRDLVERILAACRAAEGRNTSGGYGSSGLTPALRRISAQLPAGGLAPGSDADTLKPPERFAARLARLIDRQPGRPPAELAATISDAIRYTFTFRAVDYTEGTLLVHRKLKTQGFDLEARRNQWESREYKGIFTRWRDPAHGLPFEVQFHTAESWAMVRQTHDVYLRITDPDTPAPERARLRARQAAAAQAVSPPSGCMDIADFRIGTR